MNDRYIVIRRQRIIENGQQALINFKRDDLFRPFGKLLCQRADSGPDFNDSGPIRNFRMVHNSVQYICIN